MGPHEHAKERSLRLHAAVAERLLTTPALVRTAQGRVAGWRVDGTVARPYAEAWSELLDGPLDDLVRALLERSERMHDLRQVSPFAGVLDARTRWRLLKTTPS